MFGFQKLWFILNSKQRRATLLLLVCIIIGTLLETMGVGLIVPALTIMTKSNPASTYPMLAPWLDLLGNPSHEQLVVYAMLILAAVYFVKVLFLVFLSWFQAHFVSWATADFSLRLFSGYLAQPYTFHLQRNSAELIRNAMSQVSQATSAIQAYMTIVTETLLFLGLLTLMLVVETTSALWVVSVLGVASWGFYHYTKNCTKRWGEQLQTHEKLRLQYLREGLGAAKDVKVLGREKEFIERYHASNTGSAQISKWKTVISSLPRFWLELLGVIGLAAIVFIMIAQNRPMDSLIPALGLFAVAAFRLMPSANRLLVAIQNARFLLAAFDNLHKEFSLLENFKPQQDYSPIPFNNELVLENLSYRYPSTEALALKEINLSIKQGESVGIIGSTGAGKSTLVDIILGLLTPAKGTVKVDGLNIQTNSRGWQDQIGYVPQAIFLTDDTIRRNIAFGLSDGKIEEAIVWNALRDAQLEQFVKDLPEGLNTKVGEGGIRLSGGQRQRIGIARALYHNPSVLVLDEATSSLDTATEADFMEAACALKGSKTLIIVAHRLTTVEDCDYLFKIENGEIVEKGKTEFLLGEKK